MKKTSVLWSAIFAALYAILGGLGLECLLMLLGITMSVSLDSHPSYPRLLPFCMIVGFLSLILLALLVCFNIKVSRKVGFSGKLWIVQWIGAVALLLPMAKLWELFFEFLRKAF